MEPSQISCKADVSCTADKENSEELEKLCAEDALLPPQEPPAPVQVDCVDKVELELEQLTLENSCSFCSCASPEGHSE